MGEKLGVSEKTISKWETKRGMPDIGILKDLSKELQISIDDLLEGRIINNKNKSYNMLKSKFYVCPICGNVIISTGKVSMTCCGINLVPEESETIEGIVKVSRDEIEVDILSPMMKDNYVLFIAYVTNDKIDFIKMYPEGESKMIFLKRGHGIIYYYDIRKGLYCEKI